VTEVRERQQLRAIERRLRREEPGLARALDAFTRGSTRTTAPRDPVAHGVLVALLVTAASMLAGWTTTGDAGLLTGSWLVAVSTPVAWLVGLARRPVRHA
jgi:hypothetical protein